MYAHTKTLITFHEDEVQTIKNIVLNLKGRLSYQDDLLAPIYVTKAKRPTKIVAHRISLQFFKATTRSR